MRGPGQAQTDFSMFKTYGVGEHFRAQFRFEVFNLTNTPLFDGLNATYGNSAFGTITNQANYPRIVQLGLPSTLLAEGYRLGVQHRPEAARKNNGEMKKPRGRHGDVPRLSFRTQTGLKLSSRSFFDYLCERSVELGHLFVGTHGNADVLRPFRPSVGAGELDFLC